METEHKEDESECTFHDKCFKCDGGKGIQTLYIRRITPLKYGTCVTKRDTFVTVRHNYKEK